MSKIKENLSKKVLDQLGIDINPDDIYFSSYGGRLDDCERWGFKGYSCHSTATHSIRKNVKLSISEFRVGTSIEIYADPPF